MNFRKNYMKKTNNNENNNFTRTISPWLGLLGLLGFLGFLGILTYSIDGSIYGFAFFSFFGFFAFYYEGKMSGTYMDERYIENSIKAEKIANNVFSIWVALTLLMACQQRATRNLDFVLIAVVISLSLSLAVNIFLRYYLLYRFDQKDMAFEEEEE